MTLFAKLDKAEYGTKDFPVEYSLINGAHPNYNMAVHWHKEWEIIRIIEGTFDIQIDTKEYTLEQGDFALINGSALHMGKPNECVYENLVFDIHELFRTNELIKKHLRPFYRMELLPNLIYKSSEHPELSVIINKLMQAASKHKPSISDHSELAVAAYLCCFFAEILEKELYSSNPAKSIASSPKIGQIKLAIEYIENHYQETISLTALARTAGMSPKYFCRIFKEVTHQTPVDYVILYRIEQSCILLSTTSTPIIDIAMECGFNDCSYFIKTFKKFKNMTPSQYRNH